MALDRPDGAALLTTARQLLLKELLPALPESKRYEALMLASAMAMATREMEIGARLQQSALKRLAGIYEDAEIGAATDRAGRTEAYRRLSQRLCQEIRAGRFDAPGAERKRVEAHLRETTRARLQLANPKRLEALDKAASKEADQ